MKRLVLGLILSCSYGLGLAEVSVKVDKPKIQLGQTFTLTLTIEGTQINPVPDFMPLQRDFSIESSQSNINYSIVNGQVRSISEWNLLLTPKQTGVLPIPSLQVGREKTAPMSVEVTTQAPVTPPQPAVQPKQQPAQPRVMQQTQQQDVLLVTDISSSSPYVNQQVIYTVKLYNSSRLLDASYQPPQVEDALFVPIGNGRRYQLSENGRIYTIEEQQFALFPQKTGYLKIKPPSFNALIYDYSPKRISVEAQPTTLNVKPIPATFKGKSWLPARQVVLSESYDKSTASLLEGSTLVRTVTLQATAVPAQLLPTLNFANSDEFSVYPEKPIENNQFKQQDLVGTSTMKVTYLFNKAGKVVIPSLTLPWFNTVSGKEEVSSLPGFTINVVASGVSKPNSSTNTANTLAQAPSQPQQVTSEDKPAIRPGSQTTTAWWIAAAFALAWLLTMGAWGWQKKGRIVPGSTKNQILKDLEQACLANKPREARNALLKWGQIIWPKEAILNLFDLESLVNGGLKEQINQLAQVLYQDMSVKSEWQGKYLWQAVAAFKPADAIKTEKDASLPPLNRI